jgi:hypothetical protein
MTHLQDNHEKTFHFMQTMWKNFTKKMLSLEIETQEKLSSLEDTYQQVILAQKEDLELFRQKVNNIHQEKQTNIEYLQKMEEDLNNLLKVEKNADETIMLIEENKIKKISIKGVC